MKRSSVSSRALATLVVSLHVLAGCGARTRSASTGSGNDSLDAADGRYRAQIQWTSFGIPHVQARDLGSLAFGQGYALARAHVCILADQVVMVRGERARYFGAGGGANIDSDFGYRHLKLRERAAEALTKASEPMREIFAGFTAGYNRYVAEVGPQGLPAPCRGAAWVRAIEPTDLVAVNMSTAIQTGAGYFVSAIGHATRGERSASIQLPDRTATPASNAWALGSAKAASARALLVANPHFPWEGAGKFHEIHLTIPGELDVYGASIIGAPLVNIGFNQDVAWSHTVSDSRRVALYKLTLDDASPTRYRVGDELLELTPDPLVIEVADDNGLLRKETRTLYSSKYGPLLVTEQLPWSARSAFAIRDLAIGVTSAEQYLAFARARSVDGIRTALARYQATPFVNTIAIDRSGMAMYVDGSLVPKLSPTALAALRKARNSNPGVKAAWDHGLLMLDGSLPLFDFVTDPAAPHPGSIPLTEAPSLLRSDYAMNANDSYWIANPAHPITGVSPLYGDAEAPLRLRTRENVTQLEATERFDLSALERVILSNRSRSADLLGDAVIERCRAVAASTPARIAASDCDVLQRWDRKLDLDSKGAIFWREILAAFEPQELVSAGRLFQTGFDAKHPVATPSGLAPAPRAGQDPVATAIVAAKERLAKAGIPLDAPLGSVQFTVRDGDRVPIHGGGEAEGVLNKARLAPAARSMVVTPGMETGTMINERSGLTTLGYPINYGTSYLLLVALTDAGPTARAVMSYGASSDPTSPHYRDQTALYSQKQLRDVRFSAAQINADPALRSEVIDGPRQ